MIITTLDELLEHAERNRTPDCHCATCAPFHAIVELLSVPFPCGWPKPELALADEKHPAVQWEAVAGFMSPEEARAIGVGLIRAADRAESAT